MIDLSGIAKGYALDTARQIFFEEKVEKGFVDAGGDIFVKGKNLKWSSGIENPLIPDEILAIASSKGFNFICTSGGYRRYFKTSKGRLPQIINPFTGLPSTDFLSVTVLSNNGAECDALATAIFAGGEKGFTKIIKEWRGKVKVVIVKNTGKN